MSLRVASFVLGALALFVAGCAPVVYDGYYPPAYGGSVVYYDGYPGPYHHYNGWHDGGYRRWR